MKDDEPNGPRTELSAENSEHAFKPMDARQGARKALEMLMPMWNPEEAPLQELPSKYRIIVRETIGLLEGIASGTITVSQPKIATNLERIIEEVERVDGENHGCQELGLVMEIAASAGLTLEQGGVSFFSHKKIMR